MTTTIIAIIGVAGTIIGTILGFVSTTWYESLKEKARVKKELQSAINGVLFLSLSNNYPVVLNKLRQIIITDAYNMPNKELVDFYHSWLADPIVERGEPVTNMYTEEEIKQLILELENIKL